MTSSEVDGAYVEYDDRKLRLEPGRPIDLTLASTLGFRVGFPSPWGLLTAPYAFRPWDCGRFVYDSREGEVDLFSEPSQGLRLAAEPVTKKKRIGLGLRRGREDSHKGALASHIFEMARYAEVGRVDADALVVGGGLAGLSAADVLSRYGVRVVVVDFGERPGGYLGMLETPSQLDPARASNEVVGGLLERVRRAGVRILERSTYLLSPRRDLHVVETRSGLVFVSAKTVIFASGGFDSRPVFAGNWLPGIVSSDYALRLASYNIRFRSVAVVGWTDWALRIAGYIASRYADRVVLVSKYAVEPTVPYYDYAAEYGVEVVIDRITGAKPGPEGIRLDFREFESVTVDMVVSAIGPYPDAITPASIGGELVYLDSSRSPAVKVDDNLSVTKGVHVAGLAAGFTGEAAAYYSGRLAGQAAAAALGLADASDVAVERPSLMRHPQAADRLAEIAAPGGTTPLVEPDVFLAPGVGPGQLLARCPPVWLAELESLLRSTRSVLAAVEAVRLFDSPDGGREALPALVQFSSMILGIPPADALIPAFYEGAAVATRLGALTLVASAARG